MREGLRLVQYESMSGNIICDFIVKKKHFQKTIVKKVYTANSRDIMKASVDNKTQPRLTADIKKS